MALRQFARFNQCFPVRSTVRYGHHHHSPAEHKLLSGIEGHRAKLKSHPLYASIQTVPQLQTFMKSHCFAVWDFMSLLKELQRRITCVDSLWIPKPNTGSIRLVNEIVTGEESDENMAGASEDEKYISHYELYLRAMREMGAGTTEIEGFVEKIRQGVPFKTALEKTPIPEHTKKFVANTIGVLGLPTHVIASYFQFGREDPIPEMFQTILNNLEANNVKGNLECFKLYLQRHIQLDGEEHGPAGMKLVLALAKSEQELDEVIKYAKEAIESRISFWDGIYLDIQQQQKRVKSVAEC
jgi:hypothetical protein